MIKPQDKREAEKVQVTLPAACMDRVREHAKDLEGSDPEYVIAAIVHDYFDSGRHQGTGNGARPQTARQKDVKPTAGTKKGPKKEKDGKDAATA